jgi:hypothetical protein
MIQDLQMGEVTLRSRNHLEQEKEFVLSQFKNSPYYNDSNVKMAEIAINTFIYAITKEIFDPRLP